MMTYNRRLLSKFNLPSKALDGGGEASALNDMMSDPDYLRQSSSLINDALQKGFDVLQLADGDVVMTGVKTVVYQYTWDAEKKKLVRAKAKASRKRSASSAPKIQVEEDAEADAEEA